MKKVDNLLGQMDETGGLDSKDSTVSKTSSHLITIDTQIFLTVGDGGCRITSQLALSPESWRSLVTNLKSFLQTIGFHGKCLICGTSITGSERVEEHVVLQGLGIKWGKLPSGIVCKNCNNGCSNAESHLLRLGLLGALRPFYVGSKKEKIFEDESKGKIILKNDPTDGFQIHVQTKMKMPASGQGPGTLTIKVPLEEAATVHCSRALHKMAYLALATTHPFLIPSEKLLAAKQFIQYGEEKDYRPYCEDFVPGAPPGVNILFVIIGSKDKDNTIVPQKIMSALRIHHCLYSLSLMGDYPTVKEWRKGRYLGHAMEKGTRPAEFTFGLDSIRPTGKE